MSSVVISGDTSGAITLSAPAVAGTNTITLPASTGTVLTTGSPQSGGVIQTVGYSTTCIGGGSPTYASTTSTSYVTTGFSVTITPKLSTSKIFVTVNSNIYMSGTNKAGLFTIYRGATNLASGTAPSALCGIYYSAGDIITPISMTFLDSPATTSATTYTVYFSTQTSSTLYFGFPSGAASSMGVNITAQEIAA